MAEKLFGSVKRFGTRYGRTNRMKLAEIEKEQKQKQTCPACLQKKAKRLSMGIYKCSSCSAKFADGAYSVQTKTTAKKIEETEEASE